MIATNILPDSLDGTDQARPAEDALELAPDVFRVGEGEESRIVDLRRGRFYAIGTVGARMIDIAIGEGSNNVAQVVAEEYGVPRATAEQDWKDLRHALQSTGLLRSKSSKSLRASNALEKSPGNGKTLKCTVPRKLCLSILMAFCWFSLRLFGWARTVRWMRRRHAEVNDATNHDLQTIVAVDSAVRDAAARLILSPECKERALVAWQILRGRMGLPAVLLIGIRLYPFQAHAWVELQGQCVSDDEVRCREFTPIASYG